MPVSPEWIVSPPASLQPAHSLLKSATVVDEPADSRWESGFTFKPENCIEAEVWQPCGADGLIYVEFVVDATGGSVDVQYGGGPIVTLPYNFTATDLELALSESSDGLTRGFVDVRGGPGGTAGLYVQMQWDPRQVFQPFLISVADSVSDPLSGGTGLNVNVVQAGSPQYWSTGGEPLEYFGVETKKDYDGEQSNITYAPFVVEVPYTCSTWGFLENDYEGRALRQLEAGLSKAIEREFWTGEKNPANMNLTFWTPNDDAHVLNPGGAASPTAVDPATALVLLEAALGDCYGGTAGMLHAPTAVAERWAAFYFIDADEEFEDRMLRTRSREDIVVVGAGYPGTGPFGQPDPAPGTQWAFATGMVDVRLGEPMIYPETFAEALDRATNTVTFRGEQVAAANWDGCCSFAVLVDLSLTPAQDPV
jgi:hypothetical protein